MLPTLRKNWAQKMALLIGFDHLPMYTVLPTGSVLTEEKCKKLVQLSLKFNVLILCDDIYNLLYFAEDRAPRRLFAYAGDADSTMVASNGSFSKLLSPALRLGWLEVPQWMRRRLFGTGQLQSGGAMNGLVGKIISCAIRDGSLERHLQHLRPIYRDRAAAMADALDANLPAGFALKIRPKGGYFLWVESSRPVKSFDSTKFAKWLAQEKGVRILPGARCGARADNAFRLSLAFYEVDALKEATRSLCAALQEYLQINK